MDVGIAWAHGGEFLQCVADVDALGILRPNDARDVQPRGAIDLVGDVHARGADDPPLDEPHGGLGSGEQDPDNDEGRDEGENQDGNGDVPADRPMIEPVSLLHLGTELVPSERRRHVSQTSAVSAPLRLMAVHAHPDDEASKGAATTARYVAEGVEVMVVTCTGGERGDVLNAAAQADVDALGLSEVRRREMADAAATLGVRHAWLGFPDSGFPEGDPLPPLPQGCFADLPLEVTVEPLVEIIREFRPHVVTTYDENGGYPHPDHIRTHETTMAAVDAAANPAAYPQAGEPWQVMKVYYNQQFSKARVESLHLAMIDEDLDSPYHDWLKRWDERPDDAHRITTRILAEDFFDVRDRALLCHRTQIAPDSMWFAVPRDVERRVWPTEDFQLAWSKVPTTTPEDDLFAGIREAAS